MSTLNLSQQISDLNPALASAIQTYPGIVPLIILQIVMKLIFYPIALYFAAKKQQKTWFVVLFICMLFLNDFGILPILYLILNREKVVKTLKVEKKDKSKKKRL